MSTISFMPPESISNAFLKYLLALLLITAGCGQSEVVIPFKEGITISVSTDTSDISFFRYFEGLEFIPLETSKEAVLGPQLTKVVCLNDQFYILDHEQDALMIFGSDGSFIDKIARKGRGPGEYQHLLDFQVNEFTGNLELLDGWGRLLIFSHDELEFLYDIPIDLRAAHRFLNINADTIVFYTSSENQKLAFYSRSKERIFHKDFEFDEIDAINAFPQWGRTSPLRKIGDISIFQAPYDFYRVYDITNSELELYRQFDFGKANLDISRIERGNDQFFYARYWQTLRGEVPAVLNYHETENGLIIACYMFNHNIYGAFHDLRTGTTESVRFYNENQIGFMNFCYFDDEYGYHLIGLTNRNASDEMLSIMTDEQLNILKGVEPGSNPIMTRYKLRSEPMAD